MAKAAYTGLAVFAADFRLSARFPASRGEATTGWIIQSVVAEHLSHRADILAS